MPNLIVSPNVDTLLSAADNAAIRTNIELGTTSSPTFANLALTSPSLASDAPVTISQTWNAVGQTFKALVVNAAGTSDANSASGSLLADLQVGGVSKFSVRKDGRTTVGNVIVIGSSLFSWESPYLRTYSPFSCVKLDIGAVGTVLLEFDAANTLALRNAGAPQTFNVYGTSGTNNTDHRRLGLYCPTNGEATIQSQFSTPVTVTGMGSTASTATIFFTTPAAFPTGFPVGSTVSITGITPAGYNGIYTVTASNSVSVTYANTTNAAYTGGGAAVVYGFAGTVSINGVPVGLGKGNISSNVAIGTGSLNANTTGTDNVAVGFQTLNLVSGNYENVAVGYTALKAGGFRHVAIGYGAAQAGQANDGVDIGWAASFSRTSGALNTVVGRNAARTKVNGGVGNLTSFSNCVLIGSDVKAFDNGDTNEIVIGYDATGIGSNSVVLGNDSITKTALKGNVGIGTTNPVADLDIAETWNAPAISVTGAIGTGTVATISFATQAAAIPVGMTVVIAGINPSGYNGTYVVTASTTSSVSYANATTATYGSGGTVQRQFNAMRVSVTDTASDATSNLLSLDLDTSTVLGAKWRFKFEKSGTLWTIGSIQVGAGLSSAARVDLGVGTYSFGGGNGISMINGITGYILQHGATQLWRGSSDHILEQRNSGNPQTFNVYGTSSSNNTVYERMFMRYSGTALAFQIGSEQSGATSKPLEFFTNGTRKFAIAGTGINTSTFYGHADTDTTILVFRNLNGNAKGQFYVNTLGKVEFGIGTFTTGFPILLNESGNSYFNGGNVGIGTTAPTAPLEIRATAATGIRESLLKCTVSDSSNDAFHIYNGTTADGRFSPGFSGSVFSNPAPSCLNFVGQTDSTNDTGTTPVVIFATRVTSSQTDPNNATHSNVATRPLFAWSNYITTHMLMTANGNLGIGTTSPSSKLQVSAGDVEVDTIAKGVILKSPDGTRYRVTVANGGTLSVAAV